MYVVMFCVRVAQSLSLEQSAQKSDKSVILVPTSKLAENYFKNDRDLSIKLASRSHSGRSTCPECE